MYGIFAYIWLTFMVTVGIDASPMDPISFQNDGLEHLSLFKYSYEMGVSV